MTLCPSPTLAWEAHPGDTTLTNPLRWSLPVGCYDDLPSEEDGAAYLIWLGMQAAAIDVMDRVTHRRWSGPCRYEVRPCTQECRGCRRLSCSCRWDRLDLGRLLPRSLVGIVQILVDGEDVPTTDWRIDNGRYLTPIRDGLLWPWPRQDLNLLAGDDDTWYIDAVAGNHPNQMVLQGTADLAYQLWSLCQGRACDVPTNAVSITREGVTVSLEAGMIRQVPLAATIQDLYGKRPRRQRIWSPLDPAAAVRLVGGDGLSLAGYDEIVVSPTAPTDTTVVWIDTSGV